MVLICLLMSNISQAGLEMVAAAEAVLAAPKFSQCNMLCCGEAFHELGVRGAEGLIFVGTLFLPSVSQGGFGVMELKLSASRL
jgi:hypothetical protein